MNPVPTMKTIRILVVDDQAIVRVGIRQLVTQIPGVKIVGEARDGREALELVKSRQPDIVLMDIEMSGLNGMDATTQITREFPGAKVIILSTHATEPHVLQAFRAGAKGYIPKSSDVTELDLAIQSVAKDKTYLSPAVSQKFSKLVRSAGKNDSASGAAGATGTEDWGMDI
jgi:DNA-binding NarL/FixJ family response regulator